MVHLQTADLAIIPLSHGQLKHYVEVGKLESAMGLVANGRAVPEQVKEKILNRILPSIEQENSLNVFRTLWAVIHRLENQIVAEFCFKGIPEQGKVEIGYATLPEFRNRGIMTQAILEIVPWAFTHAEVEWIVAVTAPDNRASARVLEKAGFTLQHSRPEDLMWARRK